jgi:N-acetylglutamate synthase-like GNAT family acetyltransferase
MIFGNSEKYNIRRATTEDLDEIKMIADNNRKELGFVLRTSLEKSIINKEMFVAERDKRVVGFVDYHLRKDHQVTLYHIAVLADQRRRGVGQALLNVLHVEARNVGKQLILLKCPTDLLANSFYEAYGFQLVQTLNGRKRDLNVWQLPLYYGN